MSHWIKEYPRTLCQTFFCSECKNKVYYIDGRGKHPSNSKCRYPYCPFCKAKMEIEEHTMLVGTEVKLKEQK